MNRLHQAFRVFLLGSTHLSRMTPLGALIWRATTVDYSQVELRLLSWWADHGLSTLMPDVMFLGRRGVSPAHMVSAFTDDVHLTTACDIFGVSPHAVTKAMRRYAKHVNYRVAYGLATLNNKPQEDFTIDDVRYTATAYFTKPQEAI